MGIYDREYLRDRSPRPGARGIGGLRSMRMWSVNTWIIVICIAVFVLDGFMPRRWVVTDIPEWTDDKAAQIAPSQILKGKIQVTLKDRRGTPILGRQPLFVPSQMGEARVVGYRQARSMPLLQSFLHFSTERGFFKIEFWRLIGFQFLHASLGHIFFNMLGLYFFGPMVERYLGSKRYLAFYLLCGIFGALMYVALNLGGYAGHELFSWSKIPGLLFDDISTPLIGASAGVYGVLMAGAFLAPNATVLLFFILPMRLKTLAYAIVIIAFVTVVFGGQNAGGEAGHLGGAIAGFYFIRHPHHLHGFFDFLGRIDPTSHHYRTKGLAARGRAAAKGAQAAFGRTGADRVEIDRILDKIHTKGIHSLTAKEKRILREASDDR